MAAKKAQGKAAIYRQWVVVQEAALNRSYGQILPGMEWLRNFPKTWVPYFTAGRVMWDNADAETANACLEAPEDEAPAILRGKLLSRMLDKAKPAVFPEFDVAGHWIADGVFCWEPAVKPAASEERLKQIRERFPQRSFGSRWDHATPNTKDFLAEGIGGAIGRVEARLKVVAPGDERDFLCGMKLALEAFSRFVEGYANAAAKAGKAEIAASLRHISSAPPRTFFEALQLIWLRYVVFAYEQRSAMALGRLDQHLLPYFRADLASGRLTREKARDLLCEVFAYVYLSNTFAITIGGLLPDGSDGANELSLLILESARLMKVPMVSLFARFSEKSPAEYLEACASLIFEGGGMPAMLNDAVSLKQLERLGITGDDAVNHCFTGCAHLFVEGLQVPWREELLILPSVVMSALKRMRALAASEISFERIMAAFKEELAIQVKANCDSYNRELARVSSQNAPDVFYSAFTGDCIARGREHNAGGARYKGVLGLNFYGTAMAADMLMAVKKLVCDERRLGFAEVMDAVEANFKGQEPLRQQLLHGAPKFGNDIDEVDQLAAQLVQAAADECARQSPQLCDGSTMRLIFPGTAAYVSYGLDMPATPDGRRAGEPLSDSGSPYAGRDIKGLTSVLNSLAKIDHTLFNGMALNVRICPRDFKGKAGMKHFLSILEVMRQRGIQELQFNCVSSEELRQAQGNPEPYRNLLIRVAGYSDRFTNLQRELQDAIISRQEHG